MTSAVLRHSSRDGILVALALGHGALILTAPSAPIIALGFWWNANTVAHHFIHLPFFRSRSTNAFFSVYLSLLLGLPQTVWRDRHLAHHAGRPWRLKWSPQLALELTLVATLWMLVALRGPQFFFGTWLAGWAGGLLVCAIHGHFEHAGGTVSHYGKLYNLMFFNDGYHIEHHSRPAEHWSRLPKVKRAVRRGSRWPAVLRWLEPIDLEGLERLVLRSALLQSFVVDRHARAFQKLLVDLPPVRRVMIIGGGLFPRTALALRRVIPSAEITIVDRSVENLQIAHAYLDERVRTIAMSYARDLSDGIDLLIVPLSFSGDRSAFYVDPPARAVMVHDWIWHRHGKSAVVSVLLFKRINLSLRNTSRQPPF